MSAFNSVVAQMRCPQCGNVANRLVQFRYGDTWQYEYSLGDKLGWGGNDIGVPDARRVRVAGFAETCPICDSDGSEMIVIVERDVLKEVLPLAGETAPRTGEESYSVEQD
jgi:hypothetical protein